MPAKPDAKEKDAPSAAPAAAAPAAAAPKRGLGAWLPAIVVVIAAPAASWAVSQYLVIPMMQKKLAQPLAAAAAAPAPGADGKIDPKTGPALGKTYEFSNVVVNLAGTMGTRYLKTTFLITGSDPALHGVFEDHKAQLTDVTLNVLSSLTMADLEEPGSKNVLREKLVNAYNQALGHAEAEQVYFSDFVVQ